MNRFQKTIITGLGLILMAIPSSAFAIELSAPKVELSKPVGGDILPGGQVFQGDIKTSFIFSKLIPFAIRYLIGLAAALAVIAIMVGGYQYITAYGDTEKHKKAIKTMMWAVLGLVLCITAYGIVALVTSIKFT